MFLFSEKKCEHEPRRVPAYDTIRELFGEQPPELDDDDRASMTAGELDEAYDRSTRRSYGIAAFVKIADDDLKLREIRVLYNVSSGLTGELSGLWGDASGITGRVNPGTVGNVTGLDGKMDNIWGDVSNIWGVIHTHFRGTVTRLRGCITGKWGYVSKCHGDISGLKRDLRTIEGDLTGLTGEVYDLERQAGVLDGRDTRFGPARLLKARKFAADPSLPTNWVWGDASGVTGLNAGVIGDLTGLTMDVTGQRFDTAFVPPPPPEVPVIQTVWPREG